MITADPVAKAKVLVEALPYITRYAGKTVVIKYGGNAMESPEMIASFTRDVVLLHYVGLRPVVVHGGGPQISQLMKRLNQEPTFVDGYRVTGAAELDVVRMVLQKTNKEIVTAVNRHGDLAVGVSGEDANLIRAARMSSATGADLGYVGAVERIDPRVISGMLGSGFIPVVAPMGVDVDGQVYNINADHAAGAIAQALGAAKLVYLTDVAGLYADISDPESLISKCTASELRRVLESGQLSAGMIPKVASCMAALDAGVERAHILDGRIEHVLLLEFLTDEGVGTMVIPS